MDEGRINITESSPSGIAAVVDGLVERTVNATTEEILPLPNSAEDLLNLTQNAKFLKEEFVSYTSGTLPIEIILMALVTLSTYALFAVFQILMKKNHMESYGQKFGFVLENLLITLPILLGFTLLANHLLLLNILINGIVITLVYFQIRNNHRKFLTRFCNCKYSDLKLKYVTNYKANIQLTTAICILAVDFHVFPRRFAKAEVYGIGMMDMGVGTIVFSHALTSRQARLQENVNFGNILSNLKDSALLVLFGLIRMLVTKEIDYQEHVVEYGKHWNFFFTLALMKPLANTVLLTLKCGAKQPLYLILSLGSIALYQLCLSKYELESIIQNGFHGDKSRSDFIDANREGIFSSIGYLSLYFCGLFFGRQMYKKSHSLYNKLFWLGCWFVTGYVCMSLCIMYVSPISRQMANMGYYFIQVAFNSLLLLGFLLIDMVCYSLQVVLFRSKQERVIEVEEVPVAFLSKSISANLLVYFLLANVLTGIVNITFDTLKSGTAKSMCLLVFYILIVNNIVWTVSIIQQRYGSRKFSRD